MLDSNALACCVGCVALGGAGPGWQLQSNCLTDGDSPVYHDNNVNTVTFGSSHKMNI